MEDKKFTVRDILAFDRTYLANERTFLSYVRTFVGMVGAGAALIKLFDVVWAHAVGVCLLILGPILLAFGIVRYIKMKRQLKKYEPD